MSIKKWVFVSNMKNKMLLSIATVAMLSTATICLTSCASHELNIDPYEALGWSNEKENTIEIAKRQVISIEPESVGTGKDKNKFNFKIIQEVTAISSGDEFSTNLLKNPVTEANGKKSFNIIGMTPHQSAQLEITSVANKSYKKVVNIYVTEKRDTLDVAYSNMLDKIKTNYTLTTKDGSGKVVSVLNATEKAATITDGNGGAIYKLSNDAGEKFDLLGLGIKTQDEEEYAYSIIKNEDGSYKKDLKAVTTEIGLLDSSTYLGISDFQTSADDSYTIRGLQSINPNWFKSIEADKNSKDDFPLENGSVDNNTDAQYKAFLIKWSLIAFAFPVQYLNWQSSAAEESTRIDMTNAFDVNVRILTNTNIRFELKYQDETYMTYLSNIGSTSIDDSINAFIEQDNVQLSMPVIGGSEVVEADIRRCMDFINSNDYYSVNHNLENEAYYNTLYYAPNYLYSDFDTESKDLENKGYVFIPNDDNAPQGLGKAYYFHNNFSTSEFEYERATGNSGNELPEMSQEEFYASTGYYSSYPCFSKEKYLYSFHKNDVTQTQDGYVTTSPIVTEIFAEFYFNKTFEEVVKLNDDFANGYYLFLKPTDQEEYTEDEVTKYRYNKLIMQPGWSSGNNSGQISYFQIELMSKAKSTNPDATKIQTLIDKIKTEQNK